MRNKPHWFAQAIFSIGLFFAASVAIMEEYRSLQGESYSAEYRLRFDEIVANVTPLSTADLGEGYGE